MLTEEQLEFFGDQMAGLYQAFEQDLIADIARRVKKTGRYTETAELMAQAMHDAGRSSTEIRREVMRVLGADQSYQDFVEKNTVEWKQYVKKEIRKMEAEARVRGDEIVAAAGDMSFNYDLSMWEQAGEKLTKDSAIVALVDAMKERTEGELKDLTKSLGFTGAHDFTALRNLYSSQMDKAVLKVSTGTFSFDQAVNDCVRELAQSGLRSGAYKSGRVLALDSAVRMCVRTACHQLSGQISIANCEKTGTDLVEVSSHWGARESHAVWQGKIYSRSGKSKKYPDFAECHYGEVDGLMGVNCRHAFYPFFEGISEPIEWEDEPDPKDYRGKWYTYTEATQKQRRMENAIRKTKREIEAQKAIGGDTVVLEAKRRKQTKEYHEFSAAMGISPKDNRLRVVAGSSDLNRTKIGKNIQEILRNSDLKRIPQIPASTISKKIESGEYSIKLSEQQYNKHVEGTIKYQEYLQTRTEKGGNPQSILTVSAEKVQKIIEEKAGTGIIKVDRKGNPMPQEQITCDQVIGKYYYKGTYIKTKKAVIHYAKRSAHLVPIRGDNYD